MSGIFGGFDGLRIATRRSVFVSYHHDNDQWYYNELSRQLDSQFGVVTDNSLDRGIESDNPEYVMSRIRQNYITGTSCTIVLCGSQSAERKYIDWEIKATLDREHGLLGVRLPSCPQDYLGRPYYPDRLADNVRSGFAVSCTWSELTSSAQAAANLIEQAVGRNVRQIDNSRVLRTRNS